MIRITISCLILCIAALDASAEPLDAQSYEKGRAEYLAVLAQDPQNLEALVGLHDAAMALGNEEAAENWLREAELLAPDHEDVIARKDRRVVNVGPKHELIAGFGRSRFDVGNFPSWRDYFLEYRHGALGGNQQYLRAEFSERLLEAEEEGKLPHMHATMLVEPYGPGLMKVEPHVEWDDPDSGLRKDYYVHYFLHEDRPGH